MENIKPEKLFNKNSILLIQGTFASKFGDVLYSSAIGYYVYQMTSSEALMGIFTSISMFAMMFLSPLSGTISDRINRKLILIGMNILRGGSMIIIGLWCWLTPVPLPVLFILTIIVALAAVLFQPAAATVLLDVVPTQEYVRANSINASFGSVADLICKGISGFLLVKFGIAQMILFNGFVFLLAAISQSFVKVPITTIEQSMINLRQIIGDMLRGVTTLLTTAGLNTVFVVGILVNLFSAGYISLFYLVTTEKGFSTIEFGFLMTCFSGGSLIGAVLMSVFKWSANLRHKMMIAGFLIEALLMIIGLQSSGLNLVAACFFFGSLANIIANVILNSTMLLLMPTDKRGTMLGYITASSMGGFALSTLAYGFLAQHFSIIWLATIGITISTIFVLVMVLNKEVGKAVLRSEG